MRRPPRGPTRRRFAEHGLASRSGPALIRHGADSGQEAGRGRGHRRDNHQHPAPEDEDERREFIDDDYLLESDIETFEELTGKVIQPGVDEPILGVEIELEDIEPSL
jgi:hypothetical protein